MKESVYCAECKGYHEIDDLVSDGKNALLCPRFLGVVPPLILNPVDIEAEVQKRLESAKESSRED